MSLSLTLCLDPALISSAICLRCLGLFPYPSLCLHPRRGSYACLLSQQPSTSAAEIVKHFSLDRRAAVLAVERIFLPWLSTGRFLALGSASPSGTFCRLIDSFLGCRNTYADLRRLAVEKRFLPYQNPLRILPYPNMPQLSLPEGPACFRVLLPYGFRLCNPSLP